LTSALVTKNWLAIGSSDAQTRQSTGPPGQSRS
jgi:hypothetical protein